MSQQVAVQKPEEKPQIQIPPKESVFLQYNKDGIFINLIEAEDHFRNVKPGFDPGWLNCIVKHLAFIEGEASEAQSHSLIVEGEKNSRKWSEFRDEVRRLRYRIQRGLLKTPEEGIREVRRLRRMFESFNPEYDVSKCQSCGEALEQLIDRIKKVIGKYSPTLVSIEREYAEKIIDQVCRKYGVPKPELEIRRECNDPRFGLHVCEVGKDKGKIVVCEGNISAHVVLHELGHWLQCLGKLPPGEEEAEKFALRELGRVEVSKFTPIEKTYNRERINYFNGERDVPLTWREVGLVVGSQHIFKGLERGFEEIDTYMGKAGAPVFERPSTWINTVGGLVLVLLPRFVRMPGIADVLLTVGGGHMTTKVWDYIEEYMAAAPPAPAAVVAAAPIRVGSAPAPVSASPSRIGGPRGSFRVVRD